MFQLKEVNSLDTEKNPCIDEKDYSFTKCLMEYVKRETNCNLEFFTKKNDITTFCKKNEFDSYFEMLTKLKQDPLMEVQKRSGCHPKCKTMHYFYDVEKSVMTWISNYSSQAFIEPMSNVVEISSEYYEFDLNDLISSVGGNLGLFLGWSLLSISEALAVIFHEFYLFCIKNLFKHNISLFH